MSDCIFCEISQGRAPAAVLYEDEQVLAFLDTAQVTKGHTLVIPKQHTRNLLTMTADGASQLFRPIPAISQQLLTATGVGGINLVMNNEPLANQEVFHAHVHLIPRYENDGVVLASTKHPHTGAELEKLAGEIRRVNIQRSHFPRG